MNIEALLAEAASRISGVIQAPVPVKTYPTLRLESASALVPAASFLKERGFDYLEIITAVDWLGPVSPEGYPRGGANPHPFSQPEAPAAPAAKPLPVVGGGGTSAPGTPGAARNPAVSYKPAFDMVWCLADIAEKTRVFLRLEIPREDASVPTLCGLFKAADWQERETFDLLGIRFEGHPNLTKILTPDFLVGHPLRKDYAHVKDKYDD